MAAFSPAGHTAAMALCRQNISVLRAPMPSLAVDMLRPRSRVAAHRHMLGGAEHASHGHMLAGFARSACRSRRRRRLLIAPGDATKRLDRVAAADARDIAAKPAGTQPTPERAVEAAGWALLRFGSRTQPLAACLMPSLSRRRMPMCLSAALQAARQLNSRGFPFISRTTEPPRPRTVRGTCLPAPPPRAKIRALGHVCGATAADRLRRPGR